MEVSCVLEMGHCSHVRRVPKSLDEGEEENKDSFFFFLSCGQVYAYPYEVIWEVHEHIQTTNTLKPNNHNRDDMSSAPGEPLRASSCSYTHGVYSC